MKLKLFTGTKRCNDNELYKFKNGVTEVPGLRISGQKVCVTFQEFLSLQKEEISEEQLFQMIHNHE